MKKGQVSAFIIIGVIILILLGFYFYTAQEKEVVEVPEVKVVDQKSATLFVSSCLENTLKEAVVIVGQHGGYIEPVPAPAAVLEGNFVSTYIKDNTTNSPTKEQIETELGAYVDFYLNNCLNNMKPFKDQGYEVSFQPPKTNVVMESEFVTGKLNYPLTFKKDTQEFTVSNFEAVVKTRLGTIFNGVVDITERTEQGLCVTCLTDFSAENDMKFEFDVDEEIFLVNVIDNQVMINNEPFEFKFAYDFS